MSGDMMAKLTCCWGSSAFSYSPLERSPTRTLSGTTNDLSSFLRFFRVRLPTSGMFSHSSSVTTDSPRLRSANCCWIFGRSARCLASSSLSRASLQVQRCTFLGIGLRDTNRMNPPSFPPPRIHVLVHLLIYLVCFLVISFIGSSSKQAIFIIWILELVGVGFWFLATACLSLPVGECQLLRRPKSVPNSRYNFSRWAFTGRTNIRSSGES